MLKNKSYFAILFLFSSMYINAADNKLIQPKQDNQPNSVTQQSNQSTNTNDVQKAPNSELIKELDVALDKISKQDLERKKQYDEQIKQMNLEKERLNK